VLPVALYSGECALAVALILRPVWEVPIDVLTYTLLGVYGVGLIRAWELLGGTASGLSWLNHPGDAVDGREGRASVRGASAQSQTSEV
jgi:hypothetical protein